MGLFSKKKEETKSCCCGGNCTPETMAQAETAKAASGVKVVRPVYLFLGVVQKTHSFHRSMSCRFVRVCVCSGWSARSAISTHLRIF